MFPGSCSGSNSAKSTLYRLCKYYKSDACCALFLKYVFSNLCKRNIINGAKFTEFGESKLSYYDVLIMFICGPNTGEIIVTAPAYTKV